MRKIFDIFILVLVLVLPSCMEEMAPVEVTGEEEGWLTINFSAKDNLEVITKSTQSEVTESQVRNFYLFIFEKGGDKYKKYGQFFDKNNQKTTESGFNSAVEDCWYIKNATTSDLTTTGKVKVKLSGGTGSYNVYILANVDSDMVKISSDLLSNNINKEKDLLDFNVYLNQAIVYRNTYFPMSGSLKDVNVGDNTLTSTMSLERLDAKIKFVFRAGTREDDRGQRIKSFEPLKWKVVNVPRTAYVVGGDDKDHCSFDPTKSSLSDYSDYAKYFFDSGFVNFEKSNTDGSSEFAFYMLENRQVPKKAPTNYQDRSRPAKEDNGRNKECEVTYVLDGETITRDMKVFEYANDFSTYVVVTGKVDMELKDDSAGQVLAGDVQYIIHLGDWTANINASGPEDGKDTYTNYDNFKTERNTSYTYTVTVNSVNNIRVEIDSSKGGNPGDVDEGQPGASGFLTIAKEEIALCDAHYTSKTLDFHLCNFFEGGIIDAEHCIVDKMTWRVETPFNPDGGSPVNVGGIDVTEGLDYKWVTFRLNKPDASGNYLKTRRKFTTRVYAASNSERTAEQNKEDDNTPGLAGYHNDGCMDVAALVDYMRTQVKLWLTNHEASDFDNKDATEAEIRDPNHENSPKISLTVFVDEYYYTEHPLTHSKENQYLWKQFVNADDRKMQILCNSDASMDGESRSTGSVVTIQQKSIKCIFNTDESVTDLKTAWGLESTDEYEDRLWTYTNPTTSATHNYNGRLNSCYEWDLISNPWTWKDQSWSTYMTYEVDNDTPQLGGSYQGLRWSCMARNRDNDGDGKIDKNEIRWYTASTKQLLGLYVGADVVPLDARLYNRDANEQYSDDVVEVVNKDFSLKSWHQRVSSSTNAEVIYAEEGFAIGDKGSHGRSIRCVRNLGHMDASGSEDYDLTTSPQDYIQFEADPNDPGSYIFTNVFINDESLRYYSSGELPVRDDRSIENRLSKKFKTAPTLKEGPANLFWDFNVLIDEAMANNNPHPYCPDGYRVPNLRELTVMRNYMGINSSTYKDANNISCIQVRYMSRTKWFFGVQGDGVLLSTTLNKNQDKNQDGYARCGFSIADWAPLNMTLGATLKATTTRCVKDIRVD